MKRRNWFAALLFAPQVVGQTGSAILMESVTNCMYDQSGLLVTPGCESKHRTKDGAWTSVPVANRIVVKPKPANNQCPVCGTIAPVSKAREVGKKNCVSTGPDSTAIRCEPIFEKYQNCIRCAHCNAAFWQDAEE